jgi:hypothetical protein
MRTKLKNKIHGITLMQGVRIIDTSAFSNNYVQKLKQLNDYRVDAYLRLIDSLDLEIKKVSKEIKSSCCQYEPTYRSDRCVQLYPSSKNVAKAD